MIFVSILLLSLLLSSVAADNFGAKLSADLDIPLPAPIAFRIDDNIRTNVFNSGNISSKLYVPPGYWKISTKTVNPIKCPIQEACLGFFSICCLMSFSVTFLPFLFLKILLKILNSYRILHDAGGFDFFIDNSQSCAVGYSGPLCDKCVIGR